MVFSAEELPLVIEFTVGSSLHCDGLILSTLPILHNGLPGTSVLFPGGRTIPLPTDQIVAYEDQGGAAVVGFGGMKFEKEEHSSLFFRRVKEVLAPEQLSPERGWLMRLECAVITQVLGYGRPIWRPALLH